jgi:hypothetical protein
MSALKEEWKKMRERSMRKINFYNAWKRVVNVHTKKKFTKMTKEGRLYLNQSLESNLRRIQRENSADQAHQMMNEVAESIALTAWDRVWQETARMRILKKFWINLISRVNRKGREQVVRR